MLPTRHSSDHKTGRQMLTQWDCAHPRNLNPHQNLAWDNTKPKPGSSGSKQKSNLIWEKQVYWLVYLIPPHAHPPCYRHWLVQPMVMQLCSPSCYPGTVSSNNCNPLTRDTGTFFQQSCIPMVWSSALLKVWTSLWSDTILYQFTHTSNTSKGLNIQENADSNLLQTATAILAQIHRLGYKHQEKKISLYPIRQSFHSLLPLSFRNLTSKNSLQIHASFLFHTNCYSNFRD